MHANTKLPSNDSVISEFKKLYPKLSQDELCNIFKICKPTVRKWAKLLNLKKENYGLNRHNKNTLISNPSVKEEFIKLYLSNISTHILATKYNVDLTTISNWAKKLKIKRNVLKKYSSTNKAFDPNPVYYVYYLLNPSKNDEVFYVGKGCKKRVIIHYTPSSLVQKTGAKKTFNYHRAKVIKDYRNLGFKDKYIIFKDKLTELEALELEKECIKNIGRICNGGTLTNYTDGGDTAPVNIGADNYQFGKSPWEFSNSNKDCWIECENLYNLWLSYEKPKYIRFTKAILSMSCYKHKDSFRYIVKKFQSRWIPAHDSKWIVFKENYKNDK